MTNAEIGKEFMSKLYTADGKVKPKVQSFINGIKGDLKAKGIEFNVSELDEQNVNDLLLCMLIAARD